MWLSHTHRSSIWPTFRRYPWDVRLGLRRYHQCVHVHEPATELLSLALTTQDHGAHSFHTQEQGDYTGTLSKRCCVHCGRQCLWTQKSSLAFALCCVWHTSIFSLASSLRLRECEPSETANFLLPCGRAESESAEFRRRLGRQDQAQTGSLCLCVRQAAVRLLAIRPSRCHLPLTAGRCRHRCPVGMRRVRLGMHIECGHRCSH